MAQRFTLKIGDHLQTAEKKKLYNERVFSEIARRYDFITQVLSFWHDASWKRGLIKALPEQPAPLCVDIACGTGDIAFLLRRRYPHGHIIGLDITEPMLEIARQHNKFKNLRFLRQDMDCRIFSSATVDIITGGYALRNAPDLDVVLDGIHRVLKPGGVAAFLDFSKPDSAFLQKLEYWTLKIWGGFWGILFHGNHEVYSYIAESLVLFPDRIQLRKMFRQKGFQIVSFRPHFFGITELLVVRKITV